MWYYQQATLFTVSSWLFFTTITKQVIQLIHIVLVVTDYSWRYYLCSTSIPNRSLIDMWSYVTVHSRQVRFRFWVLYSSLMPKCRDYLFFSVRLLSVLRGHSGFFSSPPQRPSSSDFKGFSIPDFIHYIYFPILIIELMPKCRDYFLIFFSVRLLPVLRGHSVFHPRHNGQWPPTSKDFLSQILSITFIFLS